MSNVPTGERARCADPRPSPERPMTGWAGVRSTSAIDASPGRAGSRGIRSGQRRVKQSAVREHVAG